MRRDNAAFDSKGRRRCARPRAQQLEAERGLENEIALAESELAAPEDSPEDGPTPQFFDLSRTPLRLNSVVLEKLVRQLAASEQLNHEEIDLAVELLASD